MEWPRAELVRTVVVYQRNGTVYTNPTAGSLDVGPVFTAATDAADVARALEGAITAIPQAVDTPGIDFVPPVMQALGIKSAVAFERGLKTAILRFDDRRYAFYRFLPDPKYKMGSRREEDPMFTFPRDAPLSAIAEKIVAALDDPAWPVKQFRTRGPAKPKPLQRS